MTKPKVELKSLADSGLREPTAAEKLACAESLERQKLRPARIEMKFATGPDNPGVSMIQNEHSDGTGANAHFMESFGTSSNAFANRTLLRAINVLHSGQSPSGSGENENAFLALMGAIAPANELEAEIGLQIAALSYTSTDLLRRSHLNAGTHVEAANAYLNMAVKASRTMAAQVEALAKLRSGGKQQVIVKHVYVYGDAVVGDNTQTLFQGGEGGRAIGNNGQSHALETPDAFSSALWSEDAEWDSLPVTGSAGT